MTIRFIMPTLRAVLIAALLILLLLAFVMQDNAEEAQQDPGSRYLVLSSVMEDKEVAREIAIAKTAGPVLPIIGRLFTDGKRYEHVLFLYVKDAGFQHRIVYFKTRQSQIPIILIMLPGGIVDVKLAELFSEIKQGKEKKK